MLTLLLVALQTQKSLPPIPPDYSWVPAAVVSLAGTVFLSLLGALWRSDNTRKHHELMLALNQFEDQIFEKADQRYVRREELCNEAFRQ